jgi:hypothetical protein
MMGLRSLRAVLDQFCEGQELSIGSTAGMNAARHCLALASVRDYKHEEMLEELYRWHEVELRGLDVPGVRSRQHAAAWMDLQDSSKAA